VFEGQFIEVYLGTSDKATAKRKVSAINEKWERNYGDSPGLHPMGETGESGTVLVDRE
jgi:hypothetical protein